MKLVTGRRYATYFLCHAIPISLINKRVLIVTYTVDTQTYYDFTINVSVFSN